MSKFGKQSIEQLETLHPDLRALLIHAVDVIDFTVLEGHRDVETQNRYFSEGKSKLRFPESKHNSFPSMAVDIAPYPINWKDEKRFYFLAGALKAFANRHGRVIRWGGDWDSDNNFNDQTFNDLVHFELIGEIE